MVSTTLLNTLKQTRFVALCWLQVENRIIETNHQSRKNEMQKLWWNSKPRKKLEKEIKIKSWKRREYKKSLYLRWNWEETHLMEPSWFLEKKWNFCSFICCRKQSSSSMKSTNLYCSTLKGEETKKRRAREAK